jgi:PadR family transcriptional regulator PadR
MMSVGHIAGGKGSVMPRRRKWQKAGNGFTTYTGRVRRFLEPCILLLLKQGESHGYNLAEELKEFGFDRIPVDSSVVYRTLRRLEASGLAVSSWDTDSTSGPPRRVYRLTEEGERLLALWVADLEETERILRHFIDTYDRVSSTDRDSRS